MPKNALAKYFWNVLKNCSNEICTNEIPISREPPVFCFIKKSQSQDFIKITLAVAKRDQLWPFIVMQSQKEKMYITVVVCSCVPCTYIWALYIFLQIDNSSLLKALAKHHVSQGIWKMIRLNCTLKLMECN